MTQTTGSRTLALCAIIALSLSTGACWDARGPRLGEEWTPSDQNSALMLMMGAQQMNNAMNPAPAPAYRAPVYCNHNQYQTVCY